MTLDDQKVYDKFDPQNIGFGIENLPEQVRLAWSDTREISVPANYAKVSNIVIAGMGGSILGPHMLLSALRDRLPVPVEMVSGYDLPAYVNKNTLVILSSFSGTTEEVLSCAKDAKQAKAKIMAIAVGGPLAAMAKKEHWPAYIFDPGELAEQPRYGGGFSLVGIIGLLERAKILKLKEPELRQMMNAMSEVIDNCTVDVPGSENPAKQVAHALVGQNVLLVAAEHLAGNAHMLTNQINETAKQFCHFLLLPDINHHFMEGLRFPKNLAQGTTVIILRSELYHSRTQKRALITADVFEEHGLSVIDYVCKGKKPLDEVGEVLQFGSYVGWYLAMLNQVITTDIAVVDKFKKQMSK